MNFKCLAHKYIIFIFKNLENVKNEDTKSVVDSEERNDANEDDDKAKSKKYEDTIIINEDKTNEDKQDIKIKEQKQSVLQEIKDSARVKEDKDTDDYLLNFEKVLVNIHSKFYEWYDELRNTKVIFLFNLILFVSSVIFINLLATINFKIYFCILKEIYIYYTTFYCLKFNFINIHRLLTLLMSKQLLYV